jgi:hypothetical protein
LVVHGIVKGYGGEIFMESDPNVGTVFTIYFPITREKPKKKIQRPDTPIRLCTGYNKEICRNPPDEISAVLMKLIELPALIKTIRNELDKMGRG